MLITEELEDAWHAYDLIAEEDQVRSAPSGRFRMEPPQVLRPAVECAPLSPSGGNLLISIPQAQVLHLKGRYIDENQFVKIGAYHTLDLELNRKFQLTKREWDSIAIERVELASDVTQSADVVAVIVQDGLAYECLITLVRKIVVAIPRRRKGNVQQHEKGLFKFYDAVI